VVVLGLAGGPVGPPQLLAERQVHQPWQPCLQRPEHLPQHLLWLVQVVARLNPWCLLLQVLLHLFLELQSQAVLWGVRPSLLCVLEEPG
jgi:hypothetical protein